MSHTGFRLVLKVATLSDPEFNRIFVP